MGEVKTKLPMTAKTWCFCWMDVDVIADIVIYYIHDRRRDVDL